MQQRFAWLLLIPSVIPSVLTVRIFQKPEEFQTFNFVRVVE